MFVFERRKERTAGAKVLELVYDSEKKAVSGVVAELPTLPGEKSEIAGSFVSIQKTLMRNAFLQLMQ